MHSFDRQLTKRDKSSVRKVWLVVMSVDWYFDWVVRAALVSRDDLHPAREFVVLNYRPRGPIFLHHVPEQAFRRFSWFVQRFHNQNKARRTNTDESWFSHRNLHRDSSVEIVLVPLYRNQPANELVLVYEHYREYLTRFFERLFRLLYAGAFARQREKNNEVEIRNSSNVLRYPFEFVDVHLLR